MMNMHAGIPKAQLMAGDAMNRALTRMAHEMMEQLMPLENVVLVGIRRRGVPLAQRLSDIIEKYEHVRIPVGEVDIAMYRDDRDPAQLNVEVQEKHLPVDVTGKVVVLVDDVLHTGRTVRAAMDAILDQGRAARICLAVLIDRGHRELPIRADFVGKNEKFVEFVKGVAAVVAKEKPADMDALMAAPYGNGRTVQEEQQEMVLVIGENIKVRRFARYDKGTSIAYVHMGGRIAVLMNLEVGAGFEKNPAVEELGKDLAMQVAALNPQFLDKSEVSEEFIENEKRVRLAQAKEDPKNASKPDAIIEKIVMGGLAKYYKEICLMQQPFVKDDKVSVEDHVAAVAKELGTTIKVNCYTRFEKGEGIEKRQDDLAAEVAKLVK